MLFVRRVFAALVLPCAVSAVSVNAEEAPETLWENTFGGSSDERGESVQQTSDGGFILLGLTESYGMGNDDFWLIKTDSDGNELWNKTFGGSGDDVGRSVQQTSDGGFILLGESRANVFAKFDFWLIRTDSDGNELWNKNFGGSRHEFGYSVQQTSDDGFILLGYADSGAGGYDFWLVRTDSAGNELWNKTFGGSVSDYGISVQQTSDGGFILVGSTDSYGAGRSDVWLIRTDGDGNERWNKTFGGSENDHGRSVQQTSGDGFILAGWTKSYGAGDEDSWLIRTDGDGNELWNKTFGGSDSDTGYSVQPTSDGGFILLGSTKSYGAGNDDFWLIRTDGDGNELWNKTFGGSGEDDGKFVQQTSDGGFVLLGETGSYGAGDEDLWLIRTEGDGPPPCDLEVALSNYPESAVPGGTLAFRVDATNGCDDPLTFDRAVMNITGPASLEKLLYDDEPFTVVGSVGKDLSLGVSPGAPLGTYTVEVTISRDGEAIDADAFEVDVTG